MNLKNIVLAVAFALGFTSAAHAAPDLSGNLTVSSDYRYRGVSQTNVGPEVSGNLDITDKSGLYAGTFFSNVSSQYYENGAAYEQDFYAGYKHVVKGVTLDVGSYTDTYYHAKNGTTSYTTSEAYLAATYGPLTVKGSHSFTNYFGIPNTKGTHYLTTDLAQPVGKATLIAHFGHTFTAHHNNYDYSDINFGASYNLPKGFVVTGLYYLNTDMGAGMKAYNEVNGRALYGKNFVVSLRKNF